VKALLVLVAVLLVAAHPAAVALVLGTELAAVAVLGLLIFRRVRPYRARPYLWRYL
jgi:hypothetical protein